MTVVCAHQPDFLPWLGFFQRFRQCDLFVVLDDVQFLRRGWHHRDKIKTASGVQWLTVPVVKRGRYEQTIADVEIDNDTPWVRKHLGTLRAAYGKTAYFDAHFEAITAIYEKNHRHLIDLNMDFIGYLCSVFGVAPEVRMSSTLGTSATSTQRLVEIVTAVGGTKYLSGLGARDYLEEDAFRDAGLGVQWQAFEHPVYAQQFGAFEPGLSAIDALFNVGPGCPDLIAGQ